MERSNVFYPVSTVWERGCGLGGRSGSIPDSVPVTSLVGKIERERAMPGEAGKGAGRV